jgi:hypothetical protein
MRRPGRQTHFNAVHPATKKGTVPANPGAVRMHRLHFRNALKELARLHQALGQARRKGWLVWVDILLGLVLGYLGIAWVWYWMNWTGESFPVALLVGLLLDLAPPGAIWIRRRSRVSAAEAELDAQFADMMTEHSREVRHWGGRRVLEDRATLEDPIRELESGRGE